MSGDDQWLTIGAVIALYRSEGYEDAESTIRREVDDLVTAGTLDSYRTRGGHRRLSAAGVREHLAKRRQTE